MDAGGKIALWAGIALLLFASPYPNRLLYELGWANLVDQWSDGAFIVGLLLIVAAALSTIRREGR